MATLAASTVSVTGLAAAGPAAAGPSASTARPSAAGRTSAAGFTWLGDATRWRTRSAFSASGTAGAGAARSTARGTTSAQVAAPATAIPAALSAYVQGDRTDLQWNLAATHTQTAWQASRGTGVVVASIDSGVDPNAGDLAGQLVPGAHVSGGVLVAGSGTDELGHGTHVASVIAGNDDGHGVTGVAPGAKVMPINLGPSGELLTGPEVAGAITWAVSHGARVINLSLGFADVPTAKAEVTAICTAVAAAVRQNVVVVAAAGNDGQDVNLPKAPASCPGAISVGALDPELRPAAWSSYDGSVALAAPGSSIWSGVAPAASPLGYEALSGTSMASPFVAGTAALVVAQHPDWTPAQVRERLLSTARDLPPSGRDARTGAGVVNPPAAVGVQAPLPQPQPVIAAQAEPYASSMDSSSLPVFDQAVLHWLPDPSRQVTGYRVTRWTASSETTTTYGPDVVRAVFPAGPAGYQVTALSPAGDVPSAPVWFPLPGQDYTPVSPVTGLRATWNRNGSLSLRWVNPARNRGLADQFAVVLDNEVVLSREGAGLPSAVTIPAAAVPPGDLNISLMVGASRSQDVKETRTSLTARVPFSGTAVGAGSRRYRVDLVLADSRRQACPSRCAGRSVTVTAGGYRHVTRIDSAGHAVVLVSGAPRQKRLKVAVTVSGRPALRDGAVVVPVS